MDGPTLTLLLVALAFLVVGAALSIVGVVRGRRPARGREVTAIVVSRSESDGDDFPDRHPDFEWTDPAGGVHRTRSATKLVPGLWVGDEVVVRLDPVDESRAELVTGAPPRRELLLVGTAGVLVGIFLGIVAINEWLGTGQ
ncbi:MAG TPA: DUF3592 domain-containing protein [Marmoricola sp.]|nr:DUF3592 domain-containing protein [Marmoricola sp.]